ncbi:MULTISPECIES: hypothetical protein [Winogradskyella]|uniref:hypothetical protein n=1 Tax=Winogradskyella TaxID=286104 RepID=UPI0015C797A2|nr:MULTISPECIES: hypothetical protein [Winogradskyella]QXP80049.1 hypothetical protein H0I32_05285 [Winogradskyella sp. HaHa_3_26]
MKKIILGVLFLAFCLSSFAQRRGNYDEWLLSVGVNAMNDLASRSPFYKPGDWGFRNPISAAVEYRFVDNADWTDNFAIEGAITVNGFTGDNEYIAPIKDYNYLSLDAHAKYYFKELLFGRGRNMSWFNAYANVGLGYFHVEKTNMSANLGAGLLFWLDRAQMFGVRVQTIAKFGLNNTHLSYDNNHYQYHLQAVIRL